MIWHTGWGFPSDALCTFLPHVSVDWLGVKKESKALPLAVACAIEPHVVDT